MGLNKHGLSRHIPAPIRREVRVRSKFGCVVCRSAICDYEHIDPEFSEASNHDPSCICLLCGHCHDKVTRGQLSKATVLNRYRQVQSSEKVKRPFDDFDLNGDLTVRLGSCTFHGARKLVELNGETVLAIEPPEEGSSFPTLSGYFMDASGKELLRIEQNIWSGSSTAWDVEVKGATITVRPAPRVIGLRLRVNPPNEITVEKLDMRVGESHLELSSDWLAVERVRPDAEYYVGIEQMECFGAEVAVQVDTKRYPSPEYRGLRIVGGEGIDLVGTGVRLGVGNGMMTVKGVCIERATKTETYLLWIPFEEDDTGYEGVLPPRL
jgi:hypothetical protein